MRPTLLDCLAWLTVASATAGALALGMAVSTPTDDSAPPHFATGRRPVAATPPPAAVVPATPAAPVVRSVRAATEVAATSVVGRSH